VVQAYDNTCPRCKEPVPEDAERICCGTCFNYHHGPCWAEGCGECGGTTTLGSKSEARREEREETTSLLGVVIVATLVVWGLSIPFSWELPVSDVFAIDVLVVLRWALLVPVLVVLFRRQ